MSFQVQAKDSRKYILSESVGEYSRSYGQFQKTVKSDCLFMYLSSTPEMHKRGCEEAVVHGRE